MPLGRTCVGKVRNLHTQLKTGAGRRDTADEPLYLQRTQDKLLDLLNGCWKAHGDVRVAREVAHQVRQIPEAVWIDEFPLSTSSTGANGLVYSMFTHCGPVWALVGKGCRQRKRDTSKSGPTLSNSHTYRPNEQSRRLWIRRGAIADLGRLAVTVTTTLATSRSVSERLRCCGVVVDAFFCILLQQR